MWRRRASAGALEDWIDLSTGINRRPYPVPAHCAAALDARCRRAPISKRCTQAARQAYATSAPVLAVAGAQAAIQLLPRLAPPGRARILAPTYNEYAPVLAAAGWQVEEVGELDALAGADLAVVVNPNNPDGRQHDPAKLLALLPRVKRLVDRRELCRRRARSCRLRRRRAGGASGPALLRQVLRPCRLAARLRARQRRRYRCARSDGGTLAGLGRGDRDRAARAARSRLGRRHARAA